MGLPTGHLTHHLDWGVLIWGGLFPSRPPPHATPPLRPHSEPVSCEDFVPYFLPCHVTQLQVSWDIEAKKRKGKRKTATWMWFGAEPSWRTSPTTRKSPRWASKIRPISERLGDHFQLDCSVDWLRQVVRTKWQEWSGVRPCKRGFFVVRGRGGSVCAIHGQRSCSNGWPSGWSFSIGPYVRKTKKSGRGNFKSCWCVGNRYLLSSGSPHHQNPGTFKTNFVWKCLNIPSSFRHYSIQIAWDHRTEGMKIISQLCVHCTLVHWKCSNTMLVIEVQKGKWTERNLLSLKI